MSLFIASLNSGSNGNCYYIGNERDAVLVDAGISCRETEKRMLRLGLSMNKVRAIFISHEHSDHINGVAVLAKKYQLKVYITPKTMLNGGLALQPHLVAPFTGYEPERVGEMDITAFPKFHDAADPHSFMVSYQGINVGIFTDIGAPCQHVIQHFSQCHAAFLEANYCETLLEQGRYPYHLKRRIRSGHGHLSNTQALDIFKTHRPAHMSHLLLAHLSKDNNNPELVQNLFNAHANGTHVSVASRYAESEVYQIVNGLQTWRSGFERELGQFSLF
ncbi:phosphoribosyl 1,2-cyclic phosphodiesterase [Mucilaginibacter gracilis]|uniref:Phosphoribosyl 1,2-cyclic phosphodiesterase n=1 Tax=Mucilaginibacter gracilis TaxID=423350 RepID=A0A495J761_9SPHI|nr:MBL fold metallo-hydrolase [Mucilaginibacter gracilis]RKR84836.1 phosphoribosyl 1,2-cyclic phosphodiesterase [Mucilaginibacter gracilis]